ncbi:MAG: LamG domain-containing protein [Colwellia sp.]|nr:LamG domain-containing protein [Colwellia sp.]
MLTRLYLLLILMLLLLSPGVIAVECSVIFPGGQSFAGSGSIVTGSNRPLCNGVNCAFEDFTSVGSINLDSNLGSFPNSFGSWTFADAEYNYYSAAPDDENYRLFTSGGTSVIYISGSPVFKKGAGLNVPLSGTGDPSELLIVVNGDLKIEENSVVNGFIYVNGDVVLEKGITFNGAVSASGSFDVKEGGRYTFDSSMLDDFDPHGFCEPVVPAGTLLALHRFEQTDFTTQIDDTSGNNNHAEKLTYGKSTPDGQYCRGFESEGWNLDNQISDGFRSNLDVDNGIGIRGTVSFWFNSTINWNQGDERILFDATLEPNVFALEITQDGRLRFAFEDTANDVFVVEEQSAVNRDSNTWYYVTASWDYSNDTFALYVDGELLTQQTKNTNGLMADFTQLVFGDNASTYTQSGNAVMPSPVSSRGNYDEVRIYNKVLTQSEIQTDMNDANGCPILVAEWRMDEASWLVGGNPVVDSVSGFNGIAFNGADTVGDQCRYGKFDGVDDYVEIPHDNLLNGSDALTYVAYIRADSWSGTNQILAKSVHGGGSGRAQMGLFSEGGVFKARAETLNGRIDIQTSLPAPLEDWVHVAVVFDGTSLTLYQDGVNVASDTFSVTTLVQTTDPLNISKRVGTDQYYFHGLIDEVRVYRSALTHQEVIDLMNYIEPCSLSFIDHFEINTIDAQGLTCEADTITLRVCSDASCSTLNPDAVDVVLSVSDADGVVLNKNVTVVGGTTDISYIHTKSEVVSLSLDQTFECLTGTSTSCNVTFADSGFRFISVASGSTVLPLQLSGKPSNIGFNADVLKVEAVKTDNSGACAPLLVTGESIDMAATYQSPISGTQAVNIAGQNIGIAVNGTAFDSLPFTSVSLDFGSDTQNSAEYIFNYSDAGSVVLNARYELPDDDGNPSGNFIKGISSPIIVRPFGFLIDVTDNPKAQSADQVNSVFKNSGEDFTTTLKAVQWQSEDDDLVGEANDGIPDTGANLSNNPVTANFGNETTPETAVITHNLYLPSPGVLGNLTNRNFIDFNSGVAINGVVNSKSMTYDEVGIVSFTANLTSGSYLGASDVIGLEPYVGRFIPDHFALVKIDGDLVAMCDSGASTVPVAFAYSGQMSSASPSTGAIRYKVSLNPSFTITAKSLNGANTTLNYTGNFMKLEESSITRLVPVFDYTNDGSLGTKLAFTADLKAVTTSDLQGNEVSGVVTYIYKSGDNFFYKRELNAETNKFPTDINLTIVSVIDLDDVTAKDADGDFDNDGNPSNALDSVLTLEPTGVEIRFGRAQLENSYGPETSKLPQPLSVNYFNDGQYIVAEDDECTPYNATNMSLTNIDLINFSLAPPLPNVLPASGEFISEVPQGITRAIELTAPGAGNIGQVCVSYAIAPWLQYKWAVDEDNLQCPFVTTDIDGLFNENPFSVATFGIYRGNDRIIYQREIAK